MKTLREKRFAPLLLVSLAILGLLAGCAGSRGLRPTPNNRIRTVAVLPMVNNTNDVEGPQVTREAFTKKLEGTRYIIKPINEVDTILRDQLGITLGDQLGLLSPQQIGEKLGVDGLFYGYLLNFEDQVTGVYNLRKVRMGWKLVDVKTGKVIWGKGAGVKKELFSGSAGVAISIASNINDLKGEKIESLPASNDPMKEMPGLNSWYIIGNENVSMEESLVRGFGTKIITKATRIHLWIETEIALNRILYTHPIILTGPVGSK
ncbi:MAG: GNA1162 family protein [Nitrospinota bacterium]|nr:DUF799 domain-containing protein [Nitrospinota bacterium]